MNNQTDQELLRKYVERKSDSAFATLVERYVDLVHSAAFRMSGDPHSAKDITQCVFVALSQNARQLMHRPTLAGWLHNTARNLAAKDIRSQIRRRIREQEAAAMNELLTTDSVANWEEIAPYLDAALSELSEPERDAMLLRYFKNHDLRTVGATLGISDDAAQKRVSRAVERLREFFTKRGITVGASGLAVVISANAVQAAPVGLALTISTAAALTGTTLPTTATVTATKAIAMTALQKTIVAATIAVLAGAGIYEARQAAQLRERNQTLQQQQAPLAEQIGELTRARNDVTRKLATLRSENERLNQNTAELLKLRGQIGVLRRQVAEDQTHADSQATDAGQTSTGTGLTLTPDALHDEGNSTAEAAIQTFLWAATHKNGGRLAELFDRDSMLNVAFIKLRQADTNLSVTEAESIAKDLVDKLKLHLATESFITNGNPDSIISSRIEEVMEPNNVVPGTAVFRVTHSLRDGTAGSERLKLRQSGDQWFVTPSEESMGLSFAPIQGSDNPELHEGNHPSPNNPQSK